ncbi:MAG: 4Fe-4S binding protein [Clostridiales bacterium]|jgi:aryl-alcohol dehydrogenase-like predicted oxidoreductase/NAD-dependent dihydropyrimidine dehydrogenase PreA subunit|nr:4Fe-4S binding protein [Clostridiales bacterium]
MRVSRLGASGPTVTRLCFGTLTMSPLQADLPAEAGADLLVYAYARGVRFLDTADLYGTYPHIRRALKEAPDYIVSTKAYCYDGKTASEALERAFRGLEREFVDIFLLHEQESLHTLRGHYEALEYLSKQKSLGRVGAVGISTHYVGAVDAAGRFPEIEIVHPLINARGLGIRGGTLSDMEGAIERAHGRGTGIFAMKALGGGHLIGDSAAALKYILSLPWIDAVAVGMQSFAEIDANVRAFDGDFGVLAPLSKRQRRVMVHDWCEGCGRCAERCGQGAIRVENGRAAVDMEKCVLCGYCAGACPQFSIKVV